MQVKILLLHTDEPQSQHDSQHIRSYQVLCLDTILEKQPARMNEDNIEQEYFRFNYNSSIKIPTEASI